jgi:phage replication O-like protein O
LTSPQKENGYTPIANEILEQIAKIKLSPTQYRIIFVIWRYTYGFNRKAHDLSLGFLNKATGCEKRHLQRELKELEEMNIIKQNIKNGRSRAVSFNKHYDKWVVKTTIGETTIGEIDIGQSDNATIGQTDKGAIGEIDNQERQYIKTNIKTNIYSNFTSNSELLNALKDFEEMRKKIKKPMSDRAIKMLMTELNKLADTDEKKIAVLEQSIFNNWKGVFPLKGGFDSGADRQQSNGESESHNPGGKAPRWAAKEETL